MSSAGLWLAAHKKQVAIGGAALVGGYALYRSRHPSATSAAPAGATSASGTLSGAYPYDSSQLDQYNQLAGAISNLNDQVSAIQATPPAAAVSQVPPSAGAAFNPYTVGTMVAPGEKIVDAEQIGGGKGWVDVTSLGGLYTSPGFAVSGSAYNPHMPGSYSATVNGNTVYERTPIGVKIFKLLGKG